MLGGRGEGEGDLLIIHIVCITPFINLYTNAQERDFYLLPSNVIKQIEN